MIYFIYISRTYTVSIYNNTISTLVCLYIYLFIYITKSRVEVSPEWQRMLAAIDEEESESNANNNGNPVMVSRNILLGNDDDNDLHSHIQDEIRSHDDGFDPGMKTVL